LASIEDLSAMKLAAVAQRGARKDFLDVFAIASQGLDLRRMIDLYREKYGVSDIGHVLAGLCYFEDAERDPMPLLLAPVDWKDVKAAIRTWVKDAAR
jgi:Nucleotidyl transferase AbiEii toxin, Type IV TA system